MLGFIRKLFPEDEKPKRDSSLPLVLARRGWIPHRFPNSMVVVFLPPTVVAAFNPEGVLYGSTNAKDIEISATLHAGFEENRSSALDFVDHLASQRQLKVRELGTYRYFFDPTDEDIEATANRFWVIGVPRAVVVVSIMCNGKIPVSEPLREVRKALPQIVGQLL